VSGSLRAGLHSPSAILGELNDNLGRLRQELADLFDNGPDRWVEIRLREPKEVYGPWVDGKLTRVPCTLWTVWGGEYSIEPVSWSESIGMARNAHHPERLVVYLGVPAQREPWPHIADCRLVLPDDAHLIEDVTFWRSNEEDDGGERDESVERPAELPALQVEQLKLRKVEAVTPLRPPTMSNENWGQVLLVLNLLIPESAVKEIVAVGVDESFARELVEAWERS
jgi:hypothetical protein